MIVSTYWNKSADSSSTKARFEGNKDLRFCPGIYKPTNAFYDVWLKCWLETDTPYDTFEELWASGDVIFCFTGGTPNENRRIKENTKHVQGGDKI